MDINYFDLIIGAIVLLLGLKGILNGFFKELFGLIGIVGGVFVASRLAESVGGYLSDTIFHFSNEAAVKFTGFLIVLAVFWASMIAIGLVLKKLSSLSGLGPVDRILGFVFGASKFFLIISIVVYAAYNVKTIRKNIEKPMQNSIFFPIMVETGRFIMKMDPTEETQKISKKIDQTQEVLQEKVIEGAKEKLEEKSEAIKKAVEENISKAAKGE